MFNHEQYAKVSCAARLKEIKLINSAYMVRPEAFGAFDDPESYKHSYSGKCADFFFNEDDGLAMGRFQWQAEIKSGRKTCLKLGAEYLVLYSGIFDCDAAHVEAYFTKVGRFATYPYFRALFSHHIGESGLPFPPLPTLRERVD